MAKKSGSKLGFQLMVLPQFYTTYQLSQKIQLRGTISCNSGEIYSSEIPVSICPTDFDQDGIIDNIDLDLDNDGILNSIESDGDVVLTIFHIVK